MRKEKRIWSRILSVVMALVFTLGIAGSVTADGAGSAGYTANDGYVYHFGVDTADQVWVYAQFSPFVPILTYEGTQIEGYSIIFGLVNLETGESLEKMYCTDIPVDADENGVNYRPLNLSDSTYAAAYANKLRAIVKHTYPYLDVETVAAASGISGLTIGEAITATQIAIWKTAHGDAVQVVDFLNYTTAGNSKNKGVQIQLNTERADYNNGDAAYRKAVKERIEALYDYLMELSAEAPTKTVVSSASFVSKDSSASLTDNGDGTYNVTVNATVNVQIDSGDALTLTASMADGAYFTSVALNNGRSSHTLTIPNVPAAYADGKVTLSIDGKQALNDVYLADAVGGRYASQSMIGYLNETVSVHAETSVELDRVLEIYKTDEKGNGLPNIAFDVFYVGSVEDYNSGKLGIGSDPTDSDVKKFATFARLAGTLITDENGYASLNFGATDGVYLVKEVKNDAVVEAASPFFVILPDTSGSEVKNTFTAHLTNIVVADTIDVQKEVTSLNGEEGQYGIGDDCTWRIRTTIPKTMSNGKSYVITDTLDYRLDYQRVAKMELCQSTETDSVKSWNAVLTLTAGRDYLITTSHDTDKNGHDVNVVSISLTSVGIGKIVRTVGSDYAKYELHTYLTARINENAEIGENIPNQAFVRFMNGVGAAISDTSSSAKVEVKEGGSSSGSSDSSSDSSSSDSSESSTTSSSSSSSESSTTSSSSSSSESSTTSSSSSSSESSTTSSSSSSSESSTTSSSSSSSESSTTSSSSSSSESSTTSSSSSSSESSTTSSSSSSSESSTTSSSSSSSESSTTSSSSSSSESSTTSSSSSSSESSTTSSSSSSSESSTTSSSSSSSESSTTSSSSSSSESSTTSSSSNSSESSTTSSSSSSSSGSSSGSSSYSSGSSSHGKKDDGSKGTSSAVKDTLPDTGVFSDASRALLIGLTLMTAVMLLCGSMKKSR